MGTFRGARFRFGQAAFALHFVKVTTGASLYLVSACQTADEFVAAFRRYADRSGLFIPIAEPLAPGVRGHIAIALTDGSIVLEGEAEVAQSSTRPSPLHGRIGMTLRFVEPDAATKTTLTELERARLAMKPAPLTAIPRACDVPATPRPAPPPIGGRIDASNALAECVAIGDPTAFRTGAPKPTSDSPSSKFVIPTIPQIGARPKSASVPPALQPSPRKLTGTTPPPLPGSTPGALPAKATAPVGIGAPAMQPRTTTMAMPALAEPVVQKREILVSRQTTLGMPSVRAPADGPTGSDPVAAVSTGAASVPRRPNTPSAPPMPRHPTPYTPLPIVRKPAPELVTHLEESTERNQIPEPPLVGEEQRKSSLGVAMLHATRPDSEADTQRAAIELLRAAPEATEATDISEVPVAPASRSGSLRASEIMAAMKGDDWTMAPDASQPTVLPKDDASTKAADEKSGPHEDFVISLDPQAPGGWSAPAKVAKLPESKQNPASGNRNLAVASAEPIDAVEWADKPTGIGEALVQIDPTLMEPARRMPSVDDEDEGPISIVSSPTIDVEPPNRPAPHPPLFAPPPAHAAEPPGGSVANLFSTPPSAMPRPPAAPPLASGPQVPPTAGSRYDPTEIARFGVATKDAVVTVAKPRRAIVPIVLVAGVAVLITVVVIMLTGGKKAPKIGPNAAPGSAAAAIVGSAAPVTPSNGSDQALVAVHAIDAGVAAVQLPARTETTCNVAITSVPAGAEILLDNVTVLGTAPATIPMPCGVAQKVSVRKAKYGSATKAFTASSTATQLTIKIPPPLLQIKVTSVPAGATITVGGKVVGITPTTVKVLAGGATSITLSKDGFAPDTQKIAPRQNNATHHVALKRTIKTR
jgi:hypothetical protein